MAGLARSPREVVDQVRRLLPGAATTPRDEPSSVERILDAARAAFVADGIRATTMTRIARDAGVSREWLYRQFANRDAVAVGVAQRELTGFLDGLAAGPAPDDLATAVTEAFVYAVEWLRDHALLQRVLSTEPDVVTGQLLEASTPIVGMTVRICAGYLGVLGGLPSDVATVAAETLVRLVAAITLLPAGALDLHDPEQLRAYATAVVPAVLDGAATRS